MFEQIKKCRPRVKYQLREVHKITQYKKGCVYKTKSLGFIVCEPLYQFTDMTDIQLGAVSTKISKQLL